MKSAGYVTLTRQSGLVDEMRAVANNVANMSTTGFKAEEVIFSEHVKATGADTPSVSMARANTRRVVLDQGALNRTEGAFDLAIEGSGFFLIDVDGEVQLTRAGHFTPNQDGTLATHDGYPVLDAGGSPIFIPPDGGAPRISADGTISQQERLLGQIGVVEPTTAMGMERAGNTRFRTQDDWEPVESPRVMQGFLEKSNVNPLIQMSRMIEIQRAYELGQSFIEKENDRVANAIKTLGS